MHNTDLACVAFNWSNWVVLANVELLYLDDHLTSEATWIWGPELPLATALCWDGGIPEHSYSDWGSGYGSGDGWATLVPVVLSSRTLDWNGTGHVGEKDWTCGLPNSWWTIQLSMITFASLPWNWVCRGNCHISFD